MTSCKQVCSKCGNNKNINNFITVDQTNNPVISTTCNNCQKKQKSIIDKIIVSEKKCIKCDKVKNSTLFNKSKETKDGCSSWCKECNAEYQKQYYYMYFKQINLLELQ